MTAAGWLPADVGDLFGPDATAEESYEVLTVDVPPATWISALGTARDRLGCTYFDWLSAVDEPGTGFRVTAHVAALSPLRRLLMRTTVPHEAPALPSAVGVYAGAAWHERETHEMFGVTFEGHPALDHLLLPENFEGHPLRKDFVLAARVVKAWPGAKEPGESEHGGPKRRQMLPPGVPDPNEWGPLKGQLPPAPARPARGAARPAGDRPPRPAGERPVRRTRTASEGSASQTAAGNAAAGGTGPQSPSAPRRARTASEGSASQTAAGTTGPESPAGDTGPSTVETGASTAETAPSTPEAGASAAQAGDSTPSVGPRRARSASEGSASQRTPSDSPAGPRRARSASEGSASQRAASDHGDGDSDNGSDRRRDSRSGSAPRTPRSSDAPWHHARPAFDEPEPEPSPETPETPETPKTSESQESTGTSENPAPENTRKPADDDPENPTGPTDPADPTDPTGGPR
ncbi:NADH-quinone oxidoreductase subunit C [Streptomyces sp. NPDC006132]|uniref:NADH-quinone oxidoreductase subunit C n=1 Tax=Streptomyces sp. NPDC006132 TaxID=3156732 RepID=UPI0033D2B12A